MEMTAQPQRGLTFDDVWAALMETREQMKETGQLIRETRESQKEADRQFQASKAEYDRKFQEEKAEHDRRIADHDRMIAETDKKFQASKAEHDRMIKALNDQMGGLHNSFGELAEHLVAPSIAEKFNVLGYHFDSIAPGGKKILDDQGNELAQIDLLLENGEYSVAVEVKSKPKEKHIEHHVKRLQILRQYMDKHHDTRVIRGALAGAIFPDSVKEAAIEAGLYVIVQSGDTMLIETPKGFTPKAW
jgi:hypothetical protein